MATLLRPSAESNKTLREKLQRVAKYHRLVILTIGIYLCLAILVPAYFLLGGSVNGLMNFFQSPLVRPLGIAFVVLEIAAVILLTKELSNLVVAAIFGFAIAIPYLGRFALLLLIVLHVWATRYLRRYGIKFGLLGANPRTIGSVER